MAPTAIANATCRYHSLRATHTIQAAIPDKRIPARNAAAPTARPRQGCANQSARNSHAMMAHGSDHRKRRSREVMPMERLANAKVKRANAILDRKPLLY